MYAIKALRRREKFLWSSHEIWSTWKRHPAERVIRAVVPTKWFIILCIFYMDSTYRYRSVSLAVSQLRFWFEYLKHYVKIYVSINDAEVHFVVQFLFICEVSIFHNFDVQGFWSSGMLLWVTGLIGRSELWLYSLEGESTEVLRNVRICQSNIPEHQNLKHCLLGNSKESFFPSQYSLGCSRNSLI